MYASESEKEGAAVAAAAAKIVILRYTTRTLLLQPTNIYVKVHEVNNKYIYIVEHRAFGVDHFANDNYFRHSLHYLPYIYCIAIK
jgi:hypothetical protein